VRNGFERIVSSLLRIWPALIALMLCAAAGPAAASTEPQFKSLKLTAGEGRIPATASLMELEDPSLKLDITDVVHPVNAARFQPAALDPGTGALETANNLLLDKERELRRLALQDPLTGVANRLFLNDRIERAISHARRSGDHVALLMIDLDNFKPINDRFGHAVGDQLLIAIANRIRAMVRETDTLARIGGDEFVLLLEDVREPDGIRSTVEKLMETVRKPISTDSGDNVSVSASIGVAFAPMHAEQTAHLLDRADVEMYKAKSGGRNRYSIAA